MIEVFVVTLFDPDTKEKEDEPSLVFAFSSLEKAKTFLKDEYKKNGTKRLMLVVNDKEHDIYIEKVVLDSGLNFEWTGLDLEEIIPPTKLN